MLLDELISAGQLQLLRGKKVLQHVWTRLDHQDIALADMAQTQVAEQLGRAPDDPNNLNAAIGQTFEAKDLLVDQGVIFGNEDFGNVVFDLEMRGVFLTGTCAW